jgi:uncharacterized protein (TIGR02284 family)
MVTLVGLEVDYEDLIEDLIRLDFAAMDAHAEAIRRLENERFKDQLRAFQADHERHIRELSSVYRRIGRTPPCEAGGKRLLTSGKIALASLMGDRAILVAMKNNEDDTNTAYERAVEFDDLPGDVRAIVESALDDEQRHREWLEITLEKTQPA